MLLLIHNIILECRLVMQQTFVHVSKQICRIWNEDEPQGIAKTLLYSEIVTDWCASWARGILVHMSRTMMARTLLYTLSDVETSV